MQTTTTLGCPYCRGTSVSRIRRRGLLLRWLSPLARKYPWQCLNCGATFMGIRGRKDRAETLRASLTGHR